MFIARARARVEESRENEYEKIRGRLQHREIRRCDLREGGRSRFDSQVRKPRRPDSTRRYDVHTPQSQQPDPRQRYRSAEAPRSGGAEGRSLPGLSAGARRQPHGWQKVYGHRLRIHGRG